MSTHKVSLVVANYNGSNFLPNFLRSLTHTTYPIFQTIFVDDASTDSSLQILAKFASGKRGVLLLRNPKNVGAAASRNFALKSAAGDTIVFLDNDTAPSPSWLKFLVQALYSAPDVGAACPKMPRMEKPQIISTAGLRLIPHTGWGIALGGGRVDDGSLDQSQEVVSISAALAVKKSVISGIGGFDDRLAVHTEDLDFSWRIWLAGFRILYVPQSVVSHLSKSPDQRSQLMGASRSFVYFHINKNTIRTLLKNYSPSYLLFYLPQALAIIFLRGLIILFTQRNFTALSAAFSALVWNIANLPDTWQKRQAVQKLRCVSDTYLASKIMTHENLWQIYTRYFK